MNILQLLQQLKQQNTLWKKKISVRLSITQKELNNIIIQKEYTIGLEKKAEEISSITKKPYQETPWINSLQAAFTEQNNLCENREARQVQNFILVSLLSNKWTAFTILTKPSNIIKLSLYADIIPLLLVTFYTSKPKGTAEKKKRE